MSPIPKSNLKMRLATEGFECNKKLSDVNYSPHQPFSNLRYCPEMDVTDECYDSQIQFFHIPIVILRWTVKIGRIDITYEISVLSRYLAQPRTIPLVQDLHIFKYLDQHKKNELAFDPKYVNVENPALFQAMKCTQIQLNISLIIIRRLEVIPWKITVSLIVTITETGRSQTGILLLLKSAPIIWYSKL